MKSFMFVWCLIVAIFCGFAMPCSAGNPFTGKADQPRMAPDFPLKSKFLVVVVQWQHKLRVKMAALTREAKATGKPWPLIPLFGAALLYGMIHSAGPGHGKFVAFSYIVSGRRTYGRAVLLGNMIAFCHGISGIIIVLVLKFILEKTISGNLETASHTIQQVSYGLITLLGLVLLIKACLSIFSNDEKSGKDGTLSEQQSTRSIIMIALAVGMIPCPGVVLVMLFCISMGMPFLGVGLSLSVAMGMATTLTLVVLMGQFGKNSIIRMTGKRKIWASRVEHGLETLGACMIMLLGGTLFFSFL